MKNNTVKETWHCDTCDVYLADRKEVIAHMKSAHDETSDQPVGTRTMIGHMDGRDWFGSIFRWTFENGAILTNSYQAPRREDDPMRSL